MLDEDRQREFDKVAQELSVVVPVHWAFIRGAQATAWCAGMGVVVTWDPDLVTCPRCKDYLKKG